MTIRELLPDSKLYTIVLALSFPIYLLLGIMTIFDVSQHQNDLSNPDAALVFTIGSEAVILLLFIIYIRQTIASRSKST